MDINYNYKIDPNIFQQFGGKTKRRKAKRGKKRKSKSHLDYTQITLRKKCISASPNIDIESALKLDDSLNCSVCSISTEVQDNKSRDSEADDAQIINYSGSVSPSYSTEQQYARDTDEEGEDPYYYNFNINNIGHIGAIKTSDYLENKFHENRRKSIELDLLDLIISDDEEEEKTTITQLLNTFNLNAFHYYFSGALRIQFVDEIINYQPNKIKQSLICSDLTLAKQLSKMMKYISNGVKNGEWNGTQSKAWIAIEHNCIYNIFQYHSKFLINHKMRRKLNTLNRKYHRLKYSNNDFLRLSGFEKKYVTTNLDVGFVEIKIIIAKSPLFHRFEAGLFRIGIETNRNESISICDRLAVERNNKYLTSMFIGNFIENESCIYIKVSKCSNNRRLKINICHDPKCNFTTFDHKSYSKDFRLKTNKNTNTANVFIQQFNGFGEYAVLY